MSWLIDRAYVRKAVRQAAIEKFKQVISVSSWNSSPFGNLGICYMQLGEDKLAMEMFDKAIEIDSEYEPAIINRELLKKRTKQAVESPSPKMEMKPVHYGKDYPVKDGNLLIDDYLNDKL